MAILGPLSMDSFLVNTGMKFMQDGGYPDELVTAPLADHYDITVLVPALTVNEREHTVAKTIFDRRSTSPRDLTEDDIVGDLEPLELVEKIQVSGLTLWKANKHLGRNCQCPKSSAQEF